MAKHIAVGTAVGSRFEAGFGSVASGPRMSYVRAPESTGLRLGPEALAAPQREITVGHGGWAERFGK